jgi:hypothetical protein
VTRIPRGPLLPQGASAFQVGSIRSQTRAIRGRWRDCQAFRTFVQLKVEREPLSPWSSGSRSTRSVTARSQRG